MTLENMEEAEYPDLKGVEEVVTSRTGYWLDVENSLTQKGLGENLPEYLFQEYQLKRRSFTDLAEKLSGISGYDISGIKVKYLARKLSVPIRSKSEAASERWKDPEYRQKMSEAASERWKDQVTEETKRKLSEAHRGKTHSEETKRKMSEAHRGKTHSKETRRKISKAKSGENHPMYGKQHTGETKRKMSEAISERWKDPEYRQKMSEAISERWEDPEYARKQLEKMPLASINGYRRDIDTYAKSCWEANLARIFSYCDRDFEMDTEFELEVDEKNKDLFESDNTKILIDFEVGKKGENRKVFYEIMAHPLEDPIGLAKIDMFFNQYPDAELRVVDKRTYQRVRKWFKKKINSDSRFVGWEETGFNLKTNPDDFR